ncbi:hypothetical protein WJT74_09525 [Sphingomicrobium sp. XHP0239]|uniref:beta strand repeat-containing protein n=1 Tax=Sphingomicrobium maritimum TaxID=3133972 RepID=UPI0031CC928A
MARVILDAEGESIIVGGDDVDVIGTPGSEEVTIVSGDITLNASFAAGGDTINLPGDASDYTVRHEGAVVIFESATATVRIPTSDIGSTITLDDGADARTLLFNTETGQFELEGQAITTEPVAVDALATADPVFTSDDTSIVAENQLFALDVDASDADDDTITYSITGGADALLFAINTATGIVTFNSAPDFENPVDAGGDNVYDIEVTASDGRNSSAQDLAITVTDVFEQPTIDLGTLSASEGFIIQGMARIELGWSVSSAGDVNGDGYGDIIVGAPYGDNGGPNAGEAYVVFGSAGGFGSNVDGRQVIDLSSFSVDQGFIIQGDEAEDQSGISVSSAGDVNGDGYDDVIVGARFGDDGGNAAGEAYVVFGSGGVLGSDDGGGRQIVDLSFLSPSQGFVIRGDVEWDLAGNSVSSAGDVNGDGYDDFIIGADSGDDGGSGAGEAYIVFGSAGGYGLVDSNGRQVIDLSLFPAEEGFIIQGDAEDDRTGYSVSLAGDVNGDGYDDIIIGAVGGDDGGTSSGEAYVVFGRADGFGSDFDGRQVIDLTTLSASQGFIIQGDRAGDSAGVSVSSAGDVNGDGYDDLIIGAGGGDDGGDAAGEAYVVFGGAGDFGSDLGGRQVIDLTTLSAIQGFIIQGDLSRDRAGNSVSSAGDFNGDGYDDLIVGAPGTAGNAGDAYLIFGGTGAFGSDVGGRQLLDLSNLTVSQGFIIRGDVGFDQAGFSVSSAGDVNGDGYDDVIIGAPFGDDGGSGAGEAYVVFGRSTEIEDATPVVRTGTAGADNLVGNAGDDPLSGNSGANVIRGNAGDDFISIGDPTSADIDGDSDSDDTVTVMNLSPYGLLEADGNTYVLCNNINENVSLLISLDATVVTVFGPTPVLDLDGLLTEDPTVGVEPLAMTIDPSIDDFPQVMIAPDSLWLM